MKSIKMTTLAQFKILKEIEQHPAYSHIHRNDFLSSELLIHSPLLLPDMEKAILLVEKAIELNQKILIAGDRDVDGVTSTALLASYLRRCGALVEFVNSSDGDDYGLTGSFLDRLCQSDAGLVILLDMGSAHLNEAAQVLTDNRDVIILDHHVPDIPETIGSKIENIAFVNPRLSKFIDKLDHEGKIATVGLAFKLILGLEMKKSGLWSQVIIVDLNHTDSASKADVVIYRTGAFIERTIETIDQCQKRLIEQGFKPLVRTIQELQNQCLLLKERTADEWYALIEKSPVQFGRYLFGCSLLHRDNLLLRLLGEADLASIGLVADMVPLLGENRSVVLLGLGSERSKYANKLKIPVSQLIRPGLLALMYEAGLDPFDTNTKDLNFTINPIINAAGRLGKTEKALDLLLCENKQQARLLAADLVKLNRQRKQRTQKNQQIVDSHFSIEESHSIAFFYHTDLEPGVSGIMANR
ncbi:MAG: DHH family phosphoesterase [Leptonema sp. (in: Bacteria)]|nr:DHH family phosphoesterase [Leptonema sp. (in: bacteria)]